MSKITLIMTTPTYALKAKRLLKTNGINVETVKLTTTEKQGCTNGIKFDDRYFYDVISTLRSANISYTVHKEK